MIYAVPLQQAVQVITGQEITVVCKNLPRSWAVLDMKRIELDYRTCRALLHPYESPELAFAMDTLAHEAGHVKLNTSCEGYAEKYAKSKLWLFYHVLLGRAPRWSETNFLRLFRKRESSYYRGGC